MKIAVFLSGPIRYADKVINKIESLNTKYDFDFFVHIWAEDKTSKARDGASKVMDLIDNPTKIKALIIEEAIDMEEIVKKYGAWTDTHSHVSSMFGMFCAINKLINVLSTDVNYDTYTHILRLRTDVALFGDDFFDGIDFNSNKVYVAKNYIINDTWVSDHIMLAKNKTFKKIWGYKNFKAFEKNFSYYARNPEFFLKHKVNKKQLVNKWLRYENYQIVYNPIKESDPDTFNKLQKSEGVDAIFAFQHNQSTLESVRIFNQNLKAGNKDYFSLRLRLIRIVKRFRSKKIAV
ncbi:hypothetical protein E2R68_05100 [Psychromonas sp. RZ22]|uniref:hypothetical protein n=1 Tax=Psychromonas algarum TaxID=2555643 RepID=UPI001068CE79|nr:hypothetical protein [Psychromonas sp. RZ22]TEW55753.1 hypothetical protein E2R68_05100 [Psychromonas sp. RZ22]